jgi:two-component system response regulator QseB
MKILLVEDQVALRTMMADHLFESGFVVDAVGTIEEARAALRVSVYSGMVLDLGLPDGDGLRLLPEAGGLAILIVSGRDSLEQRVTGLNAGADDYLVKPFHLNEMEARLRAILRRPTLHSPVTLSCGALSYDPVSRDVTVRGNLIQTTALDCALLEVLLRASGSLVRAEFLHDEMYPLASVHSNALEAALSRLRQRLEKAGADVRICNHRGLGYQLVNSSSAPTRLD